MDYKKSHLSESQIEETLSLDIINALIGNVKATKSELPTSREVLTQFKHLEDVNLNHLEDPTVGLLLSSQFSRHYFGKEVQLGPEDEPIAILTDFGWSILGPYLKVDEEIDDLKLDSNDVSF